uniref:Uncharacterized protein n=1 Tax=Anguilla anguilla TaxID=7936 RepID=A0A0E9V8X9_ANGAN
MHYEFHESLRMFAFVVMVLKVFFFLFFFFFKFKPCTFLLL